jgi:ketosteroid isomerase-like protein
VDAEAVLAAAGRLVAAFAATDTRAYFDCFAPDATFVFHAEGKRLDDRAEYEALWVTWVESGWRVVSCDSTARRVQVVGDVAVFTHDVRTVTSAPAESPAAGPASTEPALGDTDAAKPGAGVVHTTTRERETIVFTRTADGLVAIHEHLSPAPPDTTA